MTDSEGLVMTLPYEQDLLDHATEFAFFPTPDPDLPPLNDYHLFALKVAWRGPGSWTVLQGSACMRKDGHMSYERQPSSRTERFIKAYRFPRDEAVALAVKHVDKLTVNGRTYIEWQRHWASKEEQ